MWLYPLNANAVAYTKCLSKNTTRPTNEKFDRQDPCTVQRNEDSSVDYAAFLNIVRKEKEEKFRRMNDITSQENKSFSPYSVSGYIFKKTEITQ